MQVWNDVSELKSSSLKLKQSWPGKIRQSIVGKRSPSELNHGVGRGIKLAIQQLKSGRRSYYSGRKQILSAAYQLDNGLTESLDVENEDGLCNVDLIPSKLPDPYEVTSLKLDWKAYLKTEPRRNRKIIFSLAKGFKAKEIAEKLRITEARLSQIRSDIARSAKAFFNDAACSHHVAFQ